MAAAAQEDMMKVGRVVLFPNNQVFVFNNEGLIVIIDRSTSMAGTNNHKAIESCLEALVKDDALMVDRHKLGVFCDTC